MTIWIDHIYVRVYEVTRSNQWMGTVMNNGVAIDYVYGPLPMPAESEIRDMVTRRVNGLHRGNLKAD